jgi:hypothetical protein
MFGSEILLLVPSHSFLLLVEMLYLSIKHNTQVWSPEIIVGHMSYCFGF